ncbi:MAG: hypothetical protein ACYTFT_09490 [Planctomycetota bacterium]
MPDHLDHDAPAPLRHARLTEQDGRALLKHRFEAAGFTIQEDHSLEVADTTVNLDGYDPEHKVGYEFLTTEEGDREEYTPAVLAELERRIRQGQLYLLLLDELDVDAEGLLFAADHFLERVQLAAGGGESAAAGGGEGE